MSIIAATANMADLIVKLKKELTTATLLGQEVYYFDPKTGDAIDVIKMKNGVPVCMFSECSLKAAMTDFPNGAFCNSTTLIKIRSDMHRLPVSEISEIDFTKALGATPPVNRTKDTQGNESFMLSERYVDNLRDTYLQVQGRYFRLRDDTDTPHDTLVARANAFIAANPANQESDQDEANGETSSTRMKM